MLKANSTIGRIKYRIRLQIGAQKKLLTSLRFWKWQIRKIYNANEGSASIICIGERQTIDRAKLYFRLDCESKPILSEVMSTPLVTDFPLPFLAKVPVYLNAVIRLDEPVEKIYAACGENIRRIIRREAPKYTLKATSDSKEIESINQNLLQPFARERHGADAVQMDDSQVHAFANGKANGDLTVMHFDQEIVACHLGYQSFPKGLNTWNAMWFGYPRVIFENKKTLGDINTLNLYLNVKRAQERGFEAYNIGMSPGEPNSNLLQWKCRRGAHPDTSGIVDYFRLYVAKSQKARFHYRWPVFWASGDSLHLSTGLVENESIERSIDSLKSVAYKKLKSFAIYNEAPLSAENRDMIEAALSKAGLECRPKWISNQVHRSQVTRNMANE